METLPNAAFSRSCDPLGHARIKKARLGTTVTLSLGTATEILIWLQRLDDDVLLKTDESSGTQSMDNFARFYDLQYHIIH